MAKKLLLKIFSGPNLGAEAILADGEYTLGRGANCDLVLDDHAIAEEHLKLTVTGDRVHAQPLGDARMLIGGKPTDGCNLPPGEYFTIGTTHLAIGFTDQQWVLKPLPVIKLGDDAAPAPREPEKPTGQPEPPKGKRRGRRVLVGATLLSIIGLLSWGAWVALTPTVQAGVVVPDGTGKALAELIAKHRVGETVKAQKTERGWIIEGHLADRESLKSLEADCRDLLPASAIRLWDSETLARATGVVLAAYHLPVIASPGAPGEVSVQGRVPDAAQWARVRERITHDVPKLLTLTDNVLTGSGRILRDSRGRAVDAASAPAAPKVAGPGGGSHVLIVKDTGETSRNDVADAKSLTNTSAKTDPAAPKQLPTKTSDVEPTPKILYAPATPLPSPTGSAPAMGDKTVGPPVLAYQSVSVGSTAWLRLADGTRVSVGGRIGGGYEITAISDEQIDARKGDSRVVYRLREGS